jgi:hypothetical protein
VREFEINAEIVSDVGGIDHFALFKNLMGVVVSGNYPRNVSSAQRET